MSNIPSTFSRNSECLQRQCEEQYSKRIHPVTLIQPDPTVPHDETASHILYHNSYKAQNVPNNYNIDPNEYNVHYRSDEISQFVDQEPFICSNYIHPNVHLGEQNALNCNYHQNNLYPIHDTYVSYLLNKCDESSASHLDNEHSFFTTSNLKNTYSGPQANSLPFTKISEKSVSPEKDILLNSFVGNLTPSGLGMYSQFGENTNICNTYSPSGLINTFESKPDINPIKKTESKQTRLLYSDVLNRAVSTDKPQSVPLKESNMQSKEKYDKIKVKKLERRKSCPCVDNSPDHQQETNSGVDKDHLNKGNKVFQKGDSSSSDQDEIYTNTQNTPKVQRAPKLNGSHKLNKEKVNKDSPSSTVQNEVGAESSPRKQFEMNTNCEKTKAAGKKNNKQGRVTKIDKSTNYINKKNKSRKKKKYFELEEHLKHWQEVLKKVGLWFWSLVWDITTMSSNLAIDFLINMYTIWKLKMEHIRTEIEFRKLFNDYFILFDNLWAEDSIFAFWRKIPFLNRSSDAIGADVESLNLAKTREEAMEHLLSNKDKDPYSILYLDVNCTGEQIRRHYKRLAMLVHPDKNDMPQAEEAFKILQKAFDLIGEPEQRGAFDLELSRQQNAQTALNEFSVLLTELQEKIVRASNTIRCTNCNGRHLRVLIDRPCYAARECAQCKIKHSAKEGDIWAETRMMGFRWVYLACMEGNIYDISQWAACQKSVLAHLTANSHNVQYRIVLNDRVPKTRSSTASSSNFQEFIYNLCANSMNQNGQDNSTRRRAPRQNSSI